MTTSPRSPLPFLGALLLMSGLFMSSSAQATQYTVGAFIRGGNASSSLGLSAALTDLPALGGLGGFGLSTRALGVQWQRNVPLLGVGAASVQLMGGYAWQGDTSAAGYLLGAQLSGSVGPVALSLKAQGWTAPVAAFAPLSAWGQGSIDGSGPLLGSLNADPLSAAPLNLAPRGHWLSAQARYRVRRDLTLDAFLQRNGTVEAAQNVAGLLGQWRAKRAEDSELSLSYQLGAQVATGFLDSGATGLLAGAQVQADDWSLSAHVLLRPQSSGLNVQWQRSVPVGQKVLDVSAYAAYEPWRAAALPLRYGVGLGGEAGRGQWQARLVGGQDAAGRNSYGAGLSWRFDSVSDSVAAAETSENAGGE